MPVRCRGAQCRGALGSPRGGRRRRIMLRFVVYAPMLQEDPAKAEAVERFKAEQMGQASRQVGALRTLCAMCTLCMLALQTMMAASTSPSGPACDVWGARSAA